MEFCWETVCQVYFSTLQFSVCQFSVILVHIAKHPARNCAEVLESLDRVSCLLSRYNISQKLFEREIGTWHMAVHLLLIHLLQLY